MLTKTIGLRCIIPLVASLWFIAFFVFLLFLGGGYEIDQIILLKNGRVLKNGTPEELNLLQTYESVSGISPLPLNIVTTDGNETNASESESISLERERLKRQVNHSQRQKENDNEFEHSETKKRKGRAKGKVY